MHCISITVGLMMNMINNEGVFVNSSIQNPTQWDYLKQFFDF